MRRLRGRRDRAHVPGPVHDAEPAPALRGAHRARCSRPTASAPLEMRVRDETLRRLAEVGIDDPIGRQALSRSSSPVGCVSASRSPPRSPRDPDLLIADEPSTALDVTTQAEILELLRSVQRARGMGLILDHPRSPRGVHHVRPGLRPVRRLVAGGRHAPRRSSASRCTRTRSDSCSPSHRSSRSSASSRRSPARSRPPTTSQDRCAFSAALPLGRTTCAGPADRRSWRSNRAGTRACVRSREIRSEMQELRDRVLALAAETAPALHGDRLRRGRGICARRSIWRRGREVAGAEGRVARRSRRGECVGLVGESGSGQDDARPVPRRPRDADRRDASRRWRRRDPTSRALVERRRGRACATPCR